MPPRRFQPAGRACAYRMAPPRTSNRRANEKALPVVVGIDEPAGYVVGRCRANLPCRGIIHVHALDLDLHPAVLAGLDLACFRVQGLNVRFPEHHEQVAGPNLFEQLVTHGKVRVHLGRQYRQFPVAPNLLHHVGIEREPAHEKHVIDIHTCTSFFCYYGVVQTVMS